MSNTDESDAEERVVLAGGAASPNIDAERVDPDSVIVQSKTSGTRTFHKNVDGHAACGAESSRKPKVWGIELAEAWASACRYCYQDRGENDPA